MKQIKLPFVGVIKRALDSNENLIHVVIGPRQVGKTTGILQLLNEYRESDYYYASADGDILKPSSWVLEKWIDSKNHNPDAIMVIDEIQKVENWSEAIKKLWDEQKIKPRGHKLKVILLGSSSLSIQKGLSESLVGRFRLHKVYHWSFKQSKEAFDMTLEDYLTFGGYPGSYQFIRNKSLWLDFINNSIIEPVIGKDILSYAKVKSPALFKQCFDIVCSYPAQEISYNKMLGQLQEKGNTDLIKHYLALFEGAFLVRQLFKYTKKKIITKTSSPKILPMCPALYSVIQDADLNEADMGRSFELMVGSELAKLPGSLYYWRDGNLETDFVYTFGKKIYAIEVKSGRKKSLKGLERFKAKYKNAEMLVIDPDNFQLLINSISQI